MWQVGDEVCYQYCVVVWCQCVGQVVDCVEVYQCQQQCVVWEVGIYEGEDWGVDYYVDGVSVDQVFDLGFGN